MAVDFPNNIVSYEFGKTVQWKIKEGRDFSQGIRNRLCSIYY